MSFRPFVSVLLGAVVTAACGTSTDPAEGFRVAEGTLAIQTTQTSYDWPSGSGAGPFIEASVTNNGSAPVYARLGDGFNSAEEQEVLFAVTHSDARVERQSGDAWLALSSGALFEGVKPVVLKPGKTYMLRAHLDGPRVTGQARIRITWFASAADVGGGNAQHDVSNTFELR